MPFTVALNFEDGVSRFIQCNPNEKVLDAAYRQKINLPMDCSDGVCGTCKCRCEQGEYSLGENYLEAALSDQEAAQGIGKAVAGQASAEGAKLVLIERALPQ